MAGLYTQYFQKSKVFLYPLLKLKKGIDFVPEQTYIAWDGLYQPSDYKFLCLYNAKKNDKFLKFEATFIEPHPALEACFSLSEDQHLYVFDMKDFKYDYKMFIRGRYSRFSIKVKDLIEEFFGKVGNISQYITSFLNPEEYHEQYAEALDINIKVISDVYELCSPPDLDKETISVEVPDQIKIFNSNSISLDKL